MVLPFTKRRGMFEGYDNAARRVIFLANREVIQFGAKEICVEHILLGVLRENELIVGSLLAGTPTIIRKEIEDRLSPPENLARKDSLPLSTHAQRILKLAARESKRLCDTNVRTAHLIFGILLEGSSVAAEVLGEHGITYQVALDKLITR